MSDAYNDFEGLRRENELLRARLEASQSDLEVYRREANKLFARLYDKPPLTEEQVQELITAPRGQPLIEVIEEFERELNGG